MTTALSYIACQSLFRISRYPMIHIKVGRCQMTLSHELSFLTLS